MSYDTQYNPYSFNPYPFQPNSYNPTLAYQQRLQAMEQANPHLAQQPPQNQQQPIPLKGRAVTGIEEAKAAQIDFDGSVHVFTDIANGKVYTKQMGVNGLAVFNTYAMQPPESPQDAPTPVTNDDISKAVEAATIALQGRIEQLESSIREIKGGLENVQPNADNRTASKQRKSNAGSTANGGE